MADQAKIGTHWEDDELDMIVADYFDMLVAELSGRSYIKSRHSAALMARIGRTHRSVEFKHQNISAVLDELGLPWIPGYKPRRNYRNAIFDAIDRHLTRYPAILEFTPSPPLPSDRPVAILVEPPVRTAASELIPERLRRLIQKFVRHSAPNTTWFEPGLGGPPGLGEPATSVAGFLLTA